MGVLEMVIEAVVIVVCGVAGVVTLVRPNMVWNLGRKLSLCHGERPSQTFNSVIWIVGVVLIGIALVHLVVSIISLL